MRRIIVCLSFLSLFTGAGCPSTPGGEGEGEGEGEGGEGEGDAGEGEGDGEGDAGEGEGDAGEGEGDAGEGEGDAGEGEGDGIPAAYRTSCLDCHGADAGGTVDGPEIRHPRPDILRYYVRNGDDNVWTGCGALGRECTVWGDQRTMDSFSTAQLSDQELNGIETFLNAFPKPTDGAGLYNDSCVYCHGPAGPIPSFTFYVKNANIVHNVDTFAEVLSTVRTGVNAGTISPDERSRYMPAFPNQVLSDADVNLIARYICSQYTSDPPIFCATIP